MWMILVASTWPRLRIPPELGADRASMFVTPIPMPAQPRAARPAPDATITVVDPSGRAIRRLQDILPADVRLRPASWRELSLDGDDPGLVVVVLGSSAAWTKIEELVGRGVRTLAFSDRPTVAEEEEALRRRAVGYVHSELPVSSLSRAVRAAIAGEFVYSRKVLGRVLRARRRQETSPAVATLTGRQREIVQLIAAGWTDKEIAGRLGIATATAQKHVTNILARLQVPNRAAAAAVAGRRRSGLGLAS